MTSIIEFVSHLHGPFPGDVDPDPTVISQFESDHLRLAIPATPCGAFVIVVTADEYHTAWMQNGGEQSMDVELAGQQLDALVGGSPVRMFAMGFHLEHMHCSVIATAHADGRCGTCTLSHNNIVTGEAAGSDPLNADVVALGKILWGQAWVGLCPCGGPFESTDGHLPTSYDNED